MKNLGSTAALFFMVLALVYEHIYHDIPNATLMVAWAIYIYISSRPEPK